MAKQLIKQIDCPQCKEKADFQVWDSVNVSLNSALKEKIKNGTFFDWQCPHCGKTTRIMYPFLYIDMLHYFMIWFGNPEQCDPELYQSMDLEGYQFRNARTFNELLEKAAILENGLDDHAIEIQKLSIVQAIYRQTEGGKTGPLPDLLLFRQMMQEDNMLFSVFKKDIANTPPLAKGIEDGKGKFQTIDFQWAKGAVNVLSAQKKAAEG